MKKIFKTLAIVAVAALGFACQNEIDEQVNGTEGEKVTVEVVGSVADLTRSTFGEINTTDKKVPSTWSGNEKVGFSAAEAALVAATNTAAAGATASFSVEFASIADGDTVYAVSPYNTDSWALGGFTGINAKYQDFFVTIPAEQTPLANSVDESTHLMVGEATYEGGAMTMTFQHVAAYANMNIINFGGNGVKEIAVTFPTNVVGQSAWCYYAGDDVGTIANLTSKTVTINPEKVSNVANGVWFTVAPVGALEGAMKVVVTDEDDKTYTKNITLTAEKGISFVKGQVSEFTVNMNGITEDVVEGSYNRITELSQLTDGCEAVIVAQKGGSYYALTANGDTKNPAQTAVTVNGETLDNASLKDALVMTVGVSNGNYTFKNGSSYMAYGSSGSDMRFVASGNTTFAVSVNGDYFNVMNTSSERYVAYRSDSSDWRAYTSISQAATSGADAALSFYVKGAKADTRLQSSLEFSQESVEVDLNGFDGTFKAPTAILTPADGDLTYSSSNTAVAIVEGNNNVTIKGVGTAVITATFAGNAEYKGCSAEYTITVVDSAATGPFWTLVTDASSLKAGDQIIIAAKDYNYAISTTQNKNNRGHAEIVKSGNTMTPNSAVQVFTLEAGTKTSTWAFKTDSGYIYAASSSKNYLKTTGTKNDNASWTVTIANTGVATIKANGSNTRNWLRYNPTNNPPIFSCYGSGQADVVIYRLQ